MTSRLLTSWSDHDNAFREILARAERSIDVFDKDLQRLPFEAREQAEILRKFLVVDDRRRLRIVLRDPEPFRRNSPRLMRLLADYPQRMQVQECSPQLASLSDSMLIVDGQHALIRFHQDNVRSKRLDDDSNECQPYSQRFAEILREGGEQISATTLGL